ncbi:hypothetical protein HYH02_014513 [Chlamydomonas schloesseri]|uniref:Sugar phosphate transporter domain-containing protein n=1 Tax=Chlamydomonas schloesseri TaxID=2026947 RepID=A0A835SXX0_9CHLO|nr:hypothetical protein HYH02_014513 [Chlamydomonas schloesseri]|eukprot:KAG2427911.1 hypothetical protein HYH02_014513 [Chlamydomonas schloesseri]
MAAANGSSAAVAAPAAAAATAGDEGVRQRIKQAAAAAATTATTTPATADTTTSASASATASADALAAEVAAKAAKWAAAVVSTALWMCFSSAVIILNNQLYRRGFKYPSTVTGMGQLMSALSGFALSAVARQPLRPTPPARVFATSLFPIAACTAASMYFGNISYLYLSVAFIQILKAFTPAITLLLGVAAGLEAPDWRLLLAIGLITGGTAGAVLVESGAPSFKWIGVISFMASSLTEAARVVGAELLNDGPRYNTAESLVYVGFPTAAVLLAVGAAVEWPAIAAATAAGAPGGLGLVRAEPWLFLAAPAVSAAVNASCFAAIAATSSLTFKVAGCVKNVAVVAYGVLAHGDSLTPLQAAGYGVSVGGFYLYSQLKRGGGGSGGGGGGNKAKKA